MQTIIFLNNAKTFLCHKEEQDLQSDYLTRSCQSSVLQAVLAYRAGTWNYWSFLGVLCRTSMRIPSEEPFHLRDLLCPIISSCSLKTIFQDFHESRNLPRKRWGYEKVTIIDNTLQFSHLLAGKCKEWDKQWCIDYQNGIGSGYEIT